MLKVRVIPCLLLRDESLVKTVRFKDPDYIGDPANTVRIFNELEVDELAMLDISATRQARGPDFKLLSEVAGECFMPLTYGGGLRRIEDIREAFRVGVEKVVINSWAAEDELFVRRAARTFGSQSIVVSIDVKKRLMGKRQVFTVSGTKKTGRDPVEYAQRMEAAGAGELLVTSIDREGTWSGFDVELTAAVADAVSVPVIAHGGAGSVDHIGEVVGKGRASAVALGSMVVYQSKGMGVLVNFPDRDDLHQAIGHS